jgi:flagellar hook-associated protein 1 FlgK
VAVTLGGTSGAPLVTGGTAQSVAMTTASDGTISFDVAGGAVTLSGGTLAGQQQVLARVADVHSQLDDLAQTVITTVNTAQAMAPRSTAVPAQRCYRAPVRDHCARHHQWRGHCHGRFGRGGRQPRYHQPHRLAQCADQRRSGRHDGRPPLSGFGHGAGAHHHARCAENHFRCRQDRASAQAGVDLDTEAINLTRFQQAFQASGRVMQVASNLFDTILAIK